MQRRTILIIDDSPEDRATFRRYLSSDPNCTYQILEAELGEDALTQLANGSVEAPNCLLLDFNLPDTGGIELLEELVQEFSSSSGTAGDHPLPWAVVMLTGSGDEATAVRAMKAGAQDYLAKGRLTAPELRRTIENACEKHHLAQQLRDKEIRLRMATAAAGIGIWELSLSNGEMVGEGRFRQLHNLPDNPSLDYEEFLVQVHDEDRERVQETLQTTHDSAVFTDLPTNIEYRVRGEGELRWIQLSHQTNPTDAGRLIGTAVEITDRKIIEAERARQAAQQERIAEAVQQSLLLVPPPDAYGGVSVVTQYQPAWDESKVGGDFFDIFAVAPDHLALLVGDATGKGVEAATFTAEIKFALRAILRDCGLSPAMAFTRLNAFVLENAALDVLHRDTSPTAAALVILNTATGEVVLSTAGAEPPLIVRSAESPDGITVEVTALGPLLGIDDTRPYVEEHYVLGYQDILVMTTDGITESRTPRFRGSDGRVQGGRFMGLEGLAAALREEASAHSSGGFRPPSDLLASVAQRVIERTLLWAGNRQHDDICLMLARRR